MKTFRDLIMWQKAMVLVTECYKVCRQFPKEEMFALGSQLKRCAKDYCRFLNISMGSLFEFQTQIEIAYNLEYISLSQFDDLYEKSRELERMLSAYINKIKENL